jgi:glycosyltransferase involved in cell wall biosynthesis
MSVRPIFLYWGRKGITALTYDIGVALAHRGDVEWRLSVSRQNEQFERFAAFGNRLMPVDTFTHGIGSLRLWRSAALGQRLANLIRTAGMTDVVTLMPHVWSALVAPAVRRAGARYHTILHDAQLHPGDRSGIVLPVLLRDAARADSVITLSDAVAEQALARGLARADRLVRLFHPANGPAGPGVAAAPGPGEPWRLLFLGRIQAYKGLPLLIDAVSQLRAEGHAVTLSVMGEGNLGDDAKRLATLGATIVNRWLNEDEIAAALSTHHAVVLAHIEASQSGVAASAVGAGAPIVATPVGGLLEQVVDGETGLLAARPDADALADALRRLITTPGLHASLAMGAMHRRHELSTDRFVARLLESLQAMAAMSGQCRSSSTAA